MTIWHDAPPTDSNSLNFQLIRTPPSKKLSMIVLSDKHEGAMLHFWRGRSTPCDMTNCQACKEGKSPRWYGYIYATPVRAFRIIIFEFTQRVAPIIQQRLSQYKTIRGHQLTAGRTGSRPNSPLSLEFDDTIHDTNRLPTPDDLTDVLERMWERREAQPLFKDLPGQQRFAMDETEQALATLKNGHVPR